MNECESCTYHRVNGLAAPHPDGWCRGQGPRQWDPLVEMSDGSTRPLSMVDVDEGPTGDGWDL